MTEIANTPNPPYFAVIFSSKRSNLEQGYAAMSEKMIGLARTQPGFLGVEMAREEVGITVSYWTDLESIKNWKQNVDHQEAQRLGREKWYSSYKLRIAKVERDYGFEY
ncbi:MAG: antibiotic biosynthesis monooxygenase [Arenicellales bacterium]